MNTTEAAHQLLEALDSLYLNDFGGYQCGPDEARDIDRAIVDLEEALEKNK
jgi:hypothetical protein